MRNNESFSRIVVALAVAVNLAVFFYVNTRPADWTNDEILCHGFFWSADTIEDPNLHTGLQTGDWAKPFGVYYVDGSFRTRQFSYLLEMLSFKFWQLFDEAFFRNYTLIFLHGVNALLLGILVHLLTKGRAVALAAAFFFLNSGPAIATLLYPFRNAKLLVVTLFLLAWIVTARSKGKVPLSVYGLFLLAMFTDEQAVFLFPVIALYVYLRDGHKAIFNRRVLGTFGVTLLVFAGLTAAFLAISFKISPVPIHTGVQEEFFKDLVTYYTTPVMLRDVALSIGGYFLRRNFGHWDMTPLGVISLIAFAGWIILVVRRFPGSTARKMCAGISIIFLLKTILLPHNAGYHIHFMPEGTVFPSLLFFSYYYVYVDAVILSVFFGICGAEAFQKRNLSWALLAVVTLWGISNAAHLKNGPADVLAFNYFHTTERQQIVANVRRIDPVIAQKDKQPVYLSFPAGDAKILRGRRHDPVPGLYGRIIPVRYLRSIEEGKAIVSYVNAAARPPAMSGGDLSNANYLYDVLSGEEYDLASLREANGPESFSPLSISKDSTRHIPIIITAGKPVKVVFFIKGATAFLVRYAGKEERGVQFYGHSYQRFEWNIDARNSSRLVLTLSLKALENSGGASLVGPFVLPADNK